MLASLAAILWFRNKNKFKISEQREYSNNLAKMHSNGMNAIHLSGLLISFACYVIFWNTFPDTIAVFNPFKQELGVKGIDNLKAVGMFCSSYLVIFVLVKNSLYFTGPNSTSFMKIKEYAKISLSMNIIKTESIGSLASVFPTIAFFALIVVSYQYGNTFGISLTYLGCICFS